jgi:VWFA-related protein
MLKTRLSAAAVFVAALTILSAQRPSASPQQPAGGQSQPQPAGQGQPASPNQPNQQTQPDQTTTFRTGVDFIRVDAFATDRKGQPVLDLTAADFEVLEDGKPQMIEDFRMVRLDRTATAFSERPRAIRSQADEETEAQRDDTRLFAIFLDEYHTRDSNAIAVREPLTRFIETQLRPTDMVAIMYPLTPTEDVIFTRDHEAIVRAINRFEGRKYEYEPRNVFEENYQREPTEVVERIRNQVVMGALEGLSARLGGLRDGRKSILFVSEGFTEMLPAQLRRGNAQAAPLPTLGVVDQRTEQMAEFQSQADLDMRMREVYSAANRNNATIYSLDPRGLAVFEFDIADAPGGIGLTDDAKMLRSTQETLRLLSLETDGRAIVNRNSLAEGLAQMVQDSSVYYLLGYSTPTPADGKFHEIRVRVKRPGVDIRARKGYWALSAEAISRANTRRSAPEIAKPIQNALAAIAPSVQAARFVRTWIGTERGEQGKTRVTLVWEPLPVQAGLRREPAGRVTVIAVDPSGAPIFRGRSPQPGETGAAAAPGAKPVTASPSTAPQRIVFDAPPGKIDLRLTVEAAAGGTLDNESKVLDVPDLTAPAAALSTPRVHRSRTARDFQAILADAAAVPVASREFSRTERLLIRFDVYAPGSEKPTPTATVLSRNGQKVADAVVANATAGGTHQIDLGLNTMAAGEYVLEISVKGTGGEDVKEYVAFRVGV